MPPPEPLPHLMRRRVPSWLDLLAVAVVTFAVFVPVLRTDFSSLDDYVMLANNRKITSPSWQGFASFWSGPAFRIYMPLAQSVWQAVALKSYVAAPVSGTHNLEPFGFKLTSVVTHALAAAAAAWAIGGVTRTRWPAVAGGLLFALHPTQVESVAWTTGLKDELCGLFSILAVGGYALHARRDRPTPWADPFWWLAFASALLATSSKPTAMVLPVLLVATDWALRRASAVRRFTSVGPFLLPAAACVLVIATAQFDPNVPDAGRLLRPLVAADAYAFYLAKMVWPAHPSVDYGRYPTAVLASGALWWTWLLPAAGVAVLMWRRSRKAWLAAVLFVVPVLPTSGLVPFDMQQYSTVTDHYAYQPMFGVGLVAALLLAHRPRVGGARVGGALVVLALAACAVLTVRAIDDWRTPETLFRRVLARNPRSWMARDLLGHNAADRGDVFTADRLTEEALRLNPFDGVALETRSHLSLLLGRYRLAADQAADATGKVAIERVELGKRMALVGAKLHDRGLAERGARYWLRADPENPFARDMLTAIVRAKASEAATRPTSAAVGGPAR